MEHTLTKTTLPFLGLEARCQLMTVDGQVCCQRTDGDVWMALEKLLRLEALLAAMGSRLREDLIITVIVE